MKKINIEITKPGKDSEGYDVSASIKLDDELHAGGIYKLEDFLDNLKEDISNLENTKDAAEEQKCIDNILEDLSGFNTEEIKNILAKINKVIIPN